MPLSIEDQTRLTAILERNRRRPELLIQVLQDMQGEYRYLPEEGIRYVAEQLGIPLPRIFHVATFYKAFSLRPRGKHVINVCRGTACHVRGSEKLSETVQRELRIRDGETSGDRLFTLECVNCVGACALAPVVVIDGVVYDKVTPDRLRKILDEYRNGKAAKAEAPAAQPSQAASGEPRGETPVAQPPPAVPEGASPEAPSGQPRAAVPQIAAAPAEGLAQAPKAPASAEAPAPQAPSQHRTSLRKERLALRRAKRKEKKRGKGHRERA